MYVTYIFRFPMERGLDGSELNGIVDSKVYDPAFLLALFAQILQPEVPIQAWLFTRNALPITLIATASENPDMRNLAFLILCRLYFHCEAGK